MKPTRVTIDCNIEHDEFEYECVVDLMYSKSEDRHGFSFGPAEILHETEVTDVECSNWSESKALLVSLVEQKLDNLPNLIDLIKAKIEADNAL